MLWGGLQGGLEVRQEGEAVRVAGRFPYGVRTELAPGYYETIAPGAFAARVNSDYEVHFLAGHDFEKPLASRTAGTLELREDNDALTFEARIAAGTSWARDFLAAHASGLVRGLSPGFRIERGGERVTRAGDVIHRTITNAALFEISAVTRAAYPSAQIEARDWSPRPSCVPPRPQNPQSRWRA